MGAGRRDIVGKQRQAGGGRGGGRYYLLVKAARPTGAARRRRWWAGRGGAHPRPVALAEQRLDQTSLLVATVRRSHGHRLLFTRRSTPTLAGQAKTPTGCKVERYASRSRSAAACSSARVVLDRGRELLPSSLPSAASSIAPRVRLASLLRATVALAALPAWWLRAGCPPAREAVDQLSLPLCLRLEAIQPSAIMYFQSAERLLAA